MFLETLKQDNPLYKYLVSKNEALVLDEVAYELESRSDKNAEDYLELTKVKNELEAIKCALCLPLTTPKGLIGILNIGQKLSGDMFTSEDINLLTTLAHQLAISMENALLQEERLNTQKQLLMADKLTSIGTMMAGMVHEIKNPIASIQGLTQVLPESTNDPEFMNSYNEMIPKQINRIKKIVDNILNYSKTPKLKKEKTDINKVIEETVDLFFHSARKKNIEFIKDLHPLPQTQADPDQLSQVFINLALNSIQAMPTGGSIWIRSKVSQNEIQIEFKDTGLGIPEDRLKNVFDPFFTMKREGTGLGMWVSYQIIKEHKGKMDVESAINQGTTFYITLPVN
ncbi:MAG: GAF domain-containing protein [Candidatus Margulisbacteria bacterium]|nr:GAF domain-containing protein [Candidatus Margulisiibacteriota bacterium]MBU1022015.1 GAF domain-containing protein [Candidatus Margulisiibacteriota bacterium]MBU1729862.1 GAF domain-containing protein [Candidatus Margulisiibacteriota bacterium]MBU1955192.1 GAF domain-containing protein [Candidatus Margulisiibacteriota bacterium]